ncbi:MAG: TRAP transporter large permease [Fusobacteriaceae bacterium]|jgi:tripartite ATP-independent transporter DctM subunit|nr:TRAP transporter large permease [Fusobacteriaceae bacterium]
MSQEAIGIILLFGTLIFLMIIRFPIAFSLGLASIITAVYLDIPFFNLYQKMAVGLKSFTFMSVPFFIMMAQIMTDGHITERLMRLCDIIVGRIRGGTAIVNVLVSMLFGGISGSSSADVSSIGAMIIPAMIDEGYDPGYSIAVTVTSSVQGVIIPPSQNMIFYVVAASSGLSISKLFIAGYIPGILLGISLLIPTVVIAYRRKYPISEKRSWRENLKVIREALLGLGAIIVVIGGIVFGICSATEAAGIAAIYALVITFFVYRNMTIKKFLNGISNCLRSLATVMAIIATSSAFCYMLSYLKVPQRLTTLLTSLTSNKSILMLLIIALLIILGCFMDMGILIILLTPMLYPIATSIGYDPYHFGIILVLGLGIGLCTPPVGTSLFLGCSIANVPIEKVIKDFIPFYAAMVILLLVITFCPVLSTWLPSIIKV